MNKRRWAALCAAAIVLCSVAVAWSIRGARLVLSDSEGDAVWLRLPLSDRERFAVSFVHSVNQTPVVDVYERRGRDIFVVECRFYNYGAGMQTDVPEDAVVSYAEDGAIVVSGYNIRMNGVIYCVGKVSDHTLSHRGVEYSLRDICGRGSLVEFNIR